MKKIFILISLFIVIFIIMFCCIKVNTSIYIGDHSGRIRPYVDIQLKIDGNVILNDSLTHYIHCLPEFEVRKKLSWGFHKISISSNKENVKKEKTIFLLPNQYIYIEFFPADTLTSLLDSSCFWDSLSINKVTELSDSIIEKYTKDIDCPTVIRESAFGIQTFFNPLRLE